MDIIIQRLVASPANRGSADSSGASERPGPLAPSASRLPQDVEQSHSGGAQALQPTNAKELQQAVDALQRKAQFSASNLQFSIDHDSGRTVVKVTDGNTQEVIRQIPPDEILQLSKELTRMQGMLLHKKA